MVNLPSDFHIYTMQGKKETLDRLLVGINSDTWWKALGNETGRLSNWIGNQARAKNTINFIQKEEVPRGHTVTYKIFVSDYRPLKSEPFRVYWRVGGNRLEYLENVASPAASILKTKNWYLIAQSTMQTEVQGSYHLIWRFFIRNNHDKSRIYDNSLKIFPTRH